MCNLYRLTQSKAEIAHLFDAIVEGSATGGNAPEMVYPGYPGLVEDEVILDIYAVVHAP